MDEEVNSTEQSEEGLSDNPHINVRKELVCDKERRKCRKKTDPVESISVQFVRKFVEQ